jgi:huntingtin
VSLTIFRSCWQPETSPNASTICPTLPAEFLQEPQVLRVYVRRCMILGWLTRQQFEEAWVSLLAVLSVPRDDDLAEDEVRSLASVTASVVQTLTALVALTLRLPRPGQLNASKPVHHSRDRPSAFLLSPRGQQLNDVQFFIQKHLEELGSTHFLKVDSSENLERSVGEDANGEYGKQRHVWLGQVSIRYILTAIRHSRDPGGGTGDVNQEVAAATDGTACPAFMDREEALAASGVDVESCLHFLLDLFDQWLAGYAHGGRQHEVAANLPPPPPLPVLTEVVRSLLVLSDLFTEARQARWMLKTLIEIHHVHPADDEVLGPWLCLGVCKALAITGGDADALERTRRMLETGLRAHHLPAKVFALHGILYLLQSEWTQPDTLTPILSLASDYLHTYLQDTSSPIGRMYFHGHSYAFPTGYVPQLNSSQYEFHPCRTLRGSPGRCVVTRLLLVGKLRGSLA